MGGGGGGSRSGGNGVVIPGLMVFANHEEYVTQLH